MIRYQIRVNVGSEERTIMFYFVHKEWQSKSDEEQNKEFDDAVKELNRIYKEYGRFATTTAVTRLFDKYGFERSIK